MNRKILAALALAALIPALLLGGCQSAARTSETAAPADTQPPAQTETPAETAAPSPTSALEQSDQPFGVYDLNAALGIPLSVNAANELYGEPLGMAGIYWAADGSTELWIEYDEVWLVLTGLPEELAQLGDGIGDALTAEDRVFDMLVNRMIVKGNGPGFAGVAGLTLGSSRDDVLRSFLNLSGSYADQPGILYTISDINADWQPGWTQSFVGGRVLSPQDASISVYNGDFTTLPVDCDEVIQYIYVDDFEEYPLLGPGQWNTYGAAEFYMKDGVVTLINLYKFTDPE